MHDAENDRQSAVTVSEMARLVGFSRDRFYDLIRAGVFPQPVYDAHSRRPFYTPELQEACLRVTNSGVGFNGRQVIFNRKKQRPQHGSSDRQRRRKPRDDRDTKRLARGIAAQLRYLGIEWKAKEALEQYLAMRYPDGADQVPQDELLRRLIAFVTSGADPR